MKKRFILSLLLFAFKGFSQSQMPPIYEIKTDTVLNDTLPNMYWQILEDRSNKLNINQVMDSPYAGRFHLDTSKNIDFSIYTNWFRFRLKNGMTHEAKIGFFGWLEQSEYYYSSSQSGKWIHKVNGQLAPWSAKDGLKMINYVPVVLQPAEEITVYLRVYNTYRFYYNKLFKFPVSFGFTGKVLEQSYHDNETQQREVIFDSFLFGLLFCSCIFNLFFFYVVREKVYLFYSVFLFILGFGRFYNEIYFSFLTEHPFFLAYLLSFYWWAPGFFLVYFIRYLLKTYKYYPVWDKLLLAVTWTQAFFWIAGFFIKPSLQHKSYLLIEQIILLVSNIPLIAILVTFLLYIKDRKSSTRLLMTSVFPWVAIWIVCGAIQAFYNSVDIFNLPRPSWVNWISDNWIIIENFTLTVMAIFFSLNLFLQFYELKKENARQALEKERLEKEKEIERGQLIEQKKIELEKEVEERTAELKQSLTELKSAQSQLIQSEKMASLGELTAGIAHEIQNPLNFMNNFSEVNTELIDEMKEELKAGKREDALVIAENIKENEQKINTHGKRADAIVKSMLQHSRVGSGKKELTDINVLADEYLRLAYHGLRAKDPTFNAAMKTDFDGSIGTISFISQDIGRVLLNLYNNSFYALNEKKKSAGAAYEPTLWVSTKKLNGQVEIIVKDNGSGMPSRVKEKIFQPFFTTKPTGQGTGLGLSLSYDIIKAHGGEINVETREGEFTEFIIILNAS